MSHSGLHRREQEVVLVLRLRFKVSSILQFSQDRGITRHLQLPSEEDNRYNEDAAGLPLLFSVGGTHNRKYVAWVFPNPSTHIKYHSLDSITFERVCCRFNLVRKNLENSLVRKVNDIVCKLQKPEYASDSSGMSGEGRWSEIWAKNKERVAKRRAR